MPSEKRQVLFATTTGHIVDAPQRCSPSRRRPPPRARATTAEVIGGSVGANYGPIPSNWLAMSATKRRRNSLRPNQTASSNHVLACASSAHGTSQKFTRAEDHFCQVRYHAARADA